jgi:predicted ribosomally synthesized peptide with nif11-like leader
MSEEQLKAFLEKVKADASLQEKLKGAKTLEEVISIAKENGHEFTADALDQSLQFSIDKVSELTDEDLEYVAGGKKGPFASWLLPCGKAHEVSNGGNACPQYSMGPCR